MTFDNLLSHFGHFCQYNIANCHCRHYSLKRMAEMAATDITDTDDISANFIFECLLSGLKANHQKRLVNVTKLKKYCEYSALCSLKIAVKTML